jgi:hypothetical protein
MQWIGEQPAELFKKMWQATRPPGHPGQMLIKSLKNKHLPYGDLKGFHIFTGCLLKA